jgi:hypothetical protein
MNNLLGINVDLKPLLPKVEMFINQSSQIIALLKENNQLLAQIIALQKAKNPPLN